MNKDLGDVTNLDESETLNRARDWGRVMKRRNTFESYFSGKRKVLHNLLNIENERNQR